MKNAGMFMISQVFLSAFSALVVNFSNSQAAP